ncbi:transposase [Streptomyces acidicola]|uniref:transposase n=1 Tax=Streptomyces acidicola TaxID=2596892 RepID=UPI00223FC237|nr:transposase [Streptomyces acidicola]
MRWRTRTGAPWRDVPERYGPWDRIYDLFRRRQRDGTWARIVTRLQTQADAKGPHHPGGQRRLHRLPGPPPCGRGLQKKGGPAEGATRRHRRRAGRS